jgi:transcriptional regulator with XRE-family HTH domain
LAQADVAEKLEVAVESISRIERGASAASLAMLGQIASALDVALEDLFAERPVRLARPVDPILTKISAIVGSKPADVRRRVLRIVKLFLEK